MTWSRFFVVLKAPRPPKQPMSQGHGQLRCITRDVRVLPWRPLAPGRPSRLDHAVRPEVVGRALRTSHLSTPLWQLLGPCLQPGTPGVHDLGDVLRQLVQRLATPALFPRRVFRRRALQRGYARRGRRGSGPGPELDGHRNRASLPSKVRTIDSTWLASLGFHGILQQLSRLHPELRLKDVMVPMPVLHLHPWLAIDLRSATHLPLDAGASASEL